MTAFIGFVRDDPAVWGARGVRDYPSLYRWSVERPEEFWAAVWRFCGVVAEERGGRDPWDVVGVGLDRMAPPDPERGPRWFAGARLNFAENLLRYRDDQPAIVSWDERGRRASLSYAELYGEVARVAAALRAHGVRTGDRVAGFLPNVPEAVVAMLATASIGAAWSSCSPDFGVKGVLDRFGQIQPRVLFCADGYRYAGKEIDCLERVREIVARIPAIERVVVVPVLREPAVVGALLAAAPVPASGPAGPEAGTGDRARTALDDELGAGTAAAPPGAVLWAAFGAGPPPRVHDAAPGLDSRNHSAAPATMTPPSIDFERHPFDHPLYVMYSSGTTGLPKCMVHGAGGTLLQHLKELVLHTDVRRESRIFYFTTCGWMMWNWLVSGLATGATVVLYDGAPLAPGRGAGDQGRPPPPGILWDMAEQEGVTVFGTSARYLALSEKAGLEPARTHDLSRLEAILSTGSPLAEHSYDYVRRSVKASARLSSISGGTDILSCFALGNPIAPVWRGELQTRGLGMAVDVFDEEGKPLRGAPGELVCTRPFPSMPVAFWGDPDGSKYRAAYFDYFPNVWRHGDWAELTEHDGLIIYGRSDATLNPGGVRIGTAEIYREVEQLPEVMESLVVGQEVGSGADADTRVVLFVRLRDGATLDDALRDRIRRQIRENTSPHHVPRRIVQVADIPRTISGKITELAVREVIHGRPVKNVDALANPAALELYRDLEELRS